jgi:hypothetical protein
LNRFQRDNSIPPNYVGFPHVGMWCGCGAVGEDGDEQVKMLTMQMRLWSCNRVTLSSTDMIYSDLGIPIYSVFRTYTTITLKYEPHMI